MIPQQAIDTVVSRIAARYRPRTIIVFGSCATGDLAKARDLDRLYYLATAPDFFAPIAECLRDAGLVTAPRDAATMRIVVDKPFKLASVVILQGVPCAHHQEWGTDAPLAREGGGPFQP